MKQNAVASQDLALLFFVFRFEYVISSWKVTGTFEKPALNIWFR